MKKILILEDSKVINNTIYESLKFKEFDCTQAFCIKEAKELFKQHSFDFLILDLHLPDGEGNEFLQELKEQVMPKVIVLTVDFEHQLREELFHLGILDYIIKDKNILLSVEEIIKILNRFKDDKHGDVLVIDDSKFICSQIESILKPRNYNVDKVYLGEDALNKLDEKKFDVIILDLELPDMNGLTILEKLKNNQETFLTPVIVLSGTYTPEKIRECLKKGASDFIRKPYILEEFLLKIDMLIDTVKKEDQIIKQKSKLDNFVKTLQKKVENEVEKNEQQQLLLFAQSRHAQMGEMISMIAHQWRQPLNALGIACQLVVNKFKNNKLDINYIDNFENNTQKQIIYMSETIDHFRNFFQKDSQKENFKLIEKVEKTVSMINSTLTMNNIQTYIDIDSNIILNSYPKELSQALLNILSNSNDAFVSNKHINKENQNIKIFTNQKDDGVYLFINDNAGGIPAQIIKDIFNPYFSTKLDKNGTGLGLYMTKMILEQKCNATIKVESKDNETTFIIKL